MRRRKPAKAALPPRSRGQLEEEYGRVWDTKELAAEFVITSVVGNQVVVRRKADDRVGTLTFQNNPPYYFAFTASPAAEGGQ
jgi:hypothetical protein